MIPEDFIESWRAHTPWQTLAMVEQDLIISRALTTLYNDPTIEDSLVFRGGTALNKLFIKPAARYSEDIDFVQRKTEPIGPTIDAIRNTLDSWLGEPKRKITERGAKLVYQYRSIEEASAKLKIEINTTEHFQVLPLKTMEFAVSSPWFNGTANIRTYEIDELMATKMRALYQRRKGRDLFDLWYLVNQGLVNVDRMIDIFNQYCANDDVRISQAEFIKNLVQKKNHPDFKIDMNVLLHPQFNWDFEEAYDFIMNNVIVKIPLEGIEDVHNLR